MGDDEDLWKKYCSFFDKDFSEQVEYSEKKLDEHFKKWQNTNTAKQLCPKGVKKFENVPLTTYDDYPILHEFGKKIEGLERAKAMGVEIFHAGTQLKEDGYYTSGGRVLNVCATAETLKEAMEKIYDSISFISFENIYFRQDIGRQTK